jgi:hypothetical protein
MAMHPWTMYEVAQARDEARYLRAMSAYRALRSKDDVVAELGVESRASRVPSLDRLLRREVGVARVPARPAV